MSCCCGFIVIKVCVLFKNCDLGWNLVLRQNRCSNALLHTDATEYQAGVPVGMHVFHINRISFTVYKIINRLPCKFIFGHISVSS